MKKLILILLLINAIVDAKAQAVFENGSGDAIILRNDTLKSFFNFRANTASESFVLSYIGTSNLKDYIVDPTKRVFRTLMIGGDLKFKVKDGLGSVYKDKKLNTGISLAFIIGVQKETYDTKTPMPTTPRSIYFKAGFSYDKYTMLDTLAATQLDHKKMEPFLTAHYNKFYSWQTANKKDFYGLFGFSFGYKKTNNTESLDDGVGFNTISTIGTYLVGEQTDGKLGDFSQYDSFPLSLDFGIIPKMFDKNMIGFNFYGRAKFNQPKTPVNLGTGIFFAKDNEPTNVIGGIGWQVNNVGNKPNSSVFVYIGYTIK